MQVSSTPQIQAYIQKCTADYRLPNTDNMKAIAAILLVLCHLTISHAQLTTRPNIGTVTPRGRFVRRRLVVRPVVRQTAWNCDEGPRLYNARQIDAGQGKVVALDRYSYPYFLIGTSWQRLSSIRFNHLSVGPVGLWGSSTSNIVYKYVAGNFVRSRGTSMKQVDAGGDDQLVGVTTSNQAYCLRCSSALTYRGVGFLGWNYLSRRLKYYTCSPKNGCWGVDTSNRVFFTRTLNSVNCGASGWTEVTGQRMSMVEVGTDGRVFGLTTGGDVYQRAGIYTGRPYPGTSWVHVPMCMRVRHLSYDLNNLWVVSNSGLILKCTGR